MTGGSPPSGGAATTGGAATGGSPPSGEVAVATGGAGATTGGAGAAAGPVATGGAGAGGRVAARRRRVRRRRLVVGAVVAAVIGSAAYAAAWFDGTVHEGPAGAAEVVTVADGASAQAIAGTLARRQVVASRLAFEGYLLLRGTPTIGAGDYLLRRHQAFGAVLARLSAGPDVFPVTVTVGITVAELAQQVGDDVPGPAWSAARFAAVAATVRSPWQPAGSTTLDGLLGAGTYLVVHGETPTTLLEQMVARFDGEAARLDLAGQAAADGVTPYQAVTIASIVVKEGYYQRNFGGVARVVYNRLAAGMPLQMDSTVLYALGQDGGPVTPSDEQVRSPYNTYLNAGLPPTPICFPSVAALTAALDPPAGSWLYFELVSRDGTMAFETTLAQHDADIALAHQRGLP